MSQNDLGRLGGDRSKIISRFLRGPVHCIVSEQTGVWPIYVIRMPKGLFAGRRRCCRSTRARQILIIKVDHRSPADRRCALYRAWPREARVACWLTVAQRVDREQGVLWTHGDDGCG